MNFAWNNLILELVQSTGNSIVSKYFDFNGVYFIDGRKANRIISNLCSLSFLYILNAYSDFIRELCTYILFIGSVPTAHRFFFLQDGCGERVKVKFS